MGNKRPDVLLCPVCSGTGVPRVLDHPFCLLLVYLSISVFYEGLSPFTHYFCYFPLYFLPVPTLSWT